MSEQAEVVAESSPAVMDVSRGPLVNLTKEERVEFRTTGELPMPKTEEAAPSSEPKPEEGKAKPVGDSEPPKEKQESAERKPKPAKTAEDRIAELEATIEKIRKGSGLEKPKAESEPAKPETKPVQQQPPTRPKPTADDKKEDGTPQYATYEDFVEDLSDWKAEQREVKTQREQREQAQASSFNSKVAEARARYENFDEVVQPTATAINTDADISPVIKQLLIESDVLPDFLFTLGSDPAELAKFVKMAKESPGKAVRYIALTESLIAEELASKNEPAKTEEPPAKPKTQAPRPPSEAGGRASAPPDALAAAIEGSGGKLTTEIKAEMTRRALAKLKS